MIKVKLVLFIHMAELVYASKLMDNFAGEFNRNMTNARKQAVKFEKLSMRSQFLVYY